MTHARTPPRPRHDERLVQHGETLITWAAVTLMTKPLTSRLS